MLSFFLILHICSPVRRRILSLLYTIHLLIAESSGGQALGRRHAVWPRMTSSVGGGGPTVHRETCERGLPHFVVLVDQSCCLPSCGSMSWPVLAQDVVELGILVDGSGGLLSCAWQLLWIHSG